MAAKKLYSNFVKKNKKVAEDDPRFDPGRMGNKKWGKKYRGALNYSKGSGRPD